MVLPTTIDFPTDADLTAAWPIAEMVLLTPRNNVITVFGMETSPTDADLLASFPIVVMVSWITFWVRLAMMETTSTVTSATPTVNSNVVMVLKDKTNNATMESTTLILNGMLADVTVPLPDAEMVLWMKMRNVMMVL